LAKEIGSLEVGKIADLVIFAKNPLTFIQNTNSIQYTMANGRLYETENMDEIWPNNRKRAEFYWEQKSQTPVIPWPEHSDALFHGGCGCHQSH
jgi:cytosine/adenosine deaminase-related metal-dependent hydrolase